MKQENIGRTLRIFLVDGRPTGMVTAEIINWTGHILVCPRLRLSDLLKRPEAKRTGVYILVGPDADGARSQVYVGESDSIDGRLPGHDRDESKDFWEKTCVVTSKDQNLNKAHAKYLEENLISAWRRAGRCTVVNTSLSSTKLSEPDIADMTYFLEQVQLILPILGMDLFERPTKESDERGGEDTFELQLAKHSVHAFARVAGDDFVVLKDSTARRDWGDRDREESGYARLRRDLFASNKIVAQPKGPALVTEDIAFTSPSTASSVILGRFDNGRKSWKVKGTKTTYGQWQTAQTEKATDASQPPGEPD